MIGSSYDAEFGRKSIPSTSGVRYRFWLVRHGETVANRDGLVIGQWDSPLSELGIEQSKRLGENIHELIKKVIVRPETNQRTTRCPQDTRMEQRRTTGKKRRIRRTPRSIRRLSPKPWTAWFSKIYSSDLGRTKQTISVMMDAGAIDKPTPTTTTTTIELDMQAAGVSPDGTQRRNIVESVDSTTDKDHGSNTITVSHPVTYDERLREIAKGLRQGFPKTWTTEQALEERRRLELPTTDIVQETTSEAWSERFSTFLVSAMSETYHSKKEDEEGKHDDDGLMINDDNTDEDSQDSLDYLEDDDDEVEDILVVTHAGSIRTILEHLVPEIHPSLLNKEYDPNRPQQQASSSTTVDGVSDTKRRLEVPNTSVTVLEITLKPKFLEYLEKQHLQAAVLKGGDLRDQIEGSGTSENRDFANRHRNGSVDVDQCGLDLDLGSNYKNLWTTKVVEFMWTGHLHEVTTNDEE